MPAADRQVDRAAAGDDVFRPWLLAGAAALLVERPLLPSEGSVTSGDSVLWPLLVLVLAAAWALRAVTRRGALARYGALDVAVLFLVAWEGLSAWLATDRGAPRPAINSAWQWLALALMFLLVRQLVRGEREARAIAAVMVALAVSMSFYAEHQYFYSIPRDQALYARDPEAALQQARVVAPPGSRQRLLFAMRVNSSEPMATFALANSLAGFLAAWLAVAVGICAAAKAWPARALWVPAALCALLILAGLLLTKSRAAIVATACGLLLTCAWWAVSRTRRVSRAVVVMSVCALVAAAAALVVGMLKGDLLTAAARSLQFRFQYWQATWSLIREYPWFGCGPGQFQNYYTLYKLPEASETVADPHNFLFEVWATAGTPAAVALLLVIALVAWRVLREIRGAAAVAEAVEPARSPAKSGAHQKPARGDKEPATIDATRHVLLGGIAGFLLAFLLGPLTSVPLGLAACAGGLLASALTVAALYPWVVRGRLPIVVPAIAAVVLSINLLAAGGIGFAGVATSWWLLAGLCLVLAEPLRRVATLPMLAALAALVALSAWYYASVYTPTLACNLAISQADQDPERAENFLRQAAAADPLSAEPRSRLAMLHWMRWQEQPADETFARFAAAIGEAQRLDPRSTALAEVQGDLALSAYRRTGQEACLQMALEGFGRAVALHPTNSLGRAKLALALAAADEPEAAGREASEALRLDALTPHADQKLAAEIVAALEPLVGPN